MLSLLVSSYSVSQTTIQVTENNGFEDPIIKQKLDDAVKILERVVNSDQFGKRVENSKYFRNNKMKGAAILQKIRTGHEENTMPDNIISLLVEVYNNKKNEIGHTTPDGIIHTNKEWILSNSATCYAAHLLHEYCHVLGFSHSWLRLPFRSKTVPYKIGNFVAQLENDECP